MHVLSLPPAFVLSQDQTLKLRIQSRHNHVVVLLELNGRSSPSKHSRKSIRKRRERLYFHSKNVTVEVYSMNNLKAETLPSSAQLPPPTFLFLIFNCQKTDRNFRPVISQTPQSLSPNTPQKLSPQEPRLSAQDLQTARKVKKLQSEFVGRQQRRRPRWCAVYRSHFTASSTGGGGKTS